MTIYHAPTPADIVRAALAATGMAAWRASLDAGHSRGNLGNALRGRMRPETAVLWLGHLHGGEWACASGPGWAVAMPEEEMRGRLSEKV